MWTTPSSVTKIIVTFKYSVQIPKQSVRYHLVKTSREMKTKQPKMRKRKRDNVGGGDNSNSQRSKTPQIPEHRWNHMLTRTKQTLVDRSQELRRYIKQSGQALEANENSIHQYYNGLIRMLQIEKQLATALVRDHRRKTTTVLERAHRHLLSDKAGVTRISKHKTQREKNKCELKSLYNTYLKPLTISNAVMKLQFPDILSPETFKTSTTTHPVTILGVVDVKRQLSTDVHRVFIPGIADMVWSYIVPPQFQGTRKFHINIHRRGLHATLCDTYLATTTKRAVHVWDMTSGQFIRQIEVQPLTSSWRILNIVALDKNRIAVEVDRQAYIQIINVHTEKVELRIQEHASMYKLVSLAGGTYLGVLCRRGFTIWCTRTGKRHDTLCGGSDVQVSSDGLAVLFGRDSPRVFYPFSDKKADVVDKVFRSCPALVNGGRSVVGLSHNTFGVWDVETGKLLKTLGTSSSKTMTAFPDDVRVMTSSYGSQDVVVYNTLTGDRHKAWKRTSWGQHDISVTPGGRVVITNYRQGHLGVWE